MTNRILLAATIALMGLPLSASAEWYKIDPGHSSVEFSVSHLAISKVKGKFTDFQGKFFYQPENTNEWQAQATIEATSINTQEADRDKHLRSADFLDVEKYPKIEFKLEKVSKFKKGKKAMLHGTLSLHGVSKPVTLETEMHGVATDPWGNVRSGFTATTTINRKEFGIMWNKVLDNGGLTVGNEVEITLEIEGIQFDPAKEKKAEMDPTKTAKKGNE